MKKNEPSQLRLLTNSILSALNSLFFSDNKKEFQRLKSFIAS